MTRRGSLLLQAGAALLAAAAARADIQHQPGTSSAVYRAWLDYSLAGDEDALARLKQLHGESSFIALEEALQAGRRGDRARMLERAERSLELDPANGEAASLLARAWFRIADEGLARFSFPADAAGKPVADPLAHAMQRAATAVELGSADAEIFDRLASAHGLLAARADANGDAAAAARERTRQREVLQAWAEQLHHEMAWQRLAEVARELQDPVAESRALARLLQLDPDSTLLAQALAEVLRDMGRAEAAIPALQRALEGEEIDKYSGPTLQLRLGEAAMDGHDAVLAERAFRSALEMDPTNLLAASGLADALWALGRHDEAAASMQDFGARLGGGDSLADRPPGATSERLDYLVTRTRWKSTHDRPDAAEDARRALAIVSATGSPRQQAGMGALLADALAGSGDVTGAIAAAREALEADPSHDSALFALLNAAWLAGDRRLVEEEIARAEKRVERGAAWYQRTASWAAARGLDAVARRHARKALELFAGPSSQKPLQAVVVASALLDAGAVAEAEALARRAFDERPFDADAAFTLADALEQLGRRDEAIALLDEYAARQPADAFLEERLAAFFSRARLHARARIAAARARELAASGADALRARFEALSGEVALGAGDAEEAATWFSAASGRGLAPVPGRVLDHATALERAGRPAEALVLVEAASARLPGHSGLDLERARLLLLAGRSSDAAAVLERVLAQEREVPGRHGQVALLLAEHGDPAAARAVVAAAIDRFPRHAGTRLVAARVAEKQGLLDQAIARSREALALEPESAVMLNALGYLLADSGVELDEAVRLLRRAIEQRPHEAAYLDSLGWALLRQGHREEATRLLEQAVSRDRDPVILMHLATSREQSGRVAEALPLYQEALAAGLAEDVARVTERVRELTAVRQDRP